MFACFFFFASLLICYTKQKVRWFYMARPGRSRLLFYPGSRRKCLQKNTSAISCCASSSHTRWRCDGPRLGSFRKSSSPLRNWELRRNSTFDAKGKVKGGKKSRKVHSPLDRGGVKKCLSKTSRLKRKKERKTLQAVVVKSSAQNISPRDVPYPLDAAAWIVPSSTEKQVIASIKLLSSLKRFV